MIISKMNCDQNQWQPREVFNINFRISIQNDWCHQHPYFPPSTRVINLEFTLFRDSFQNMTFNSSVIHWDSELYNNTVIMYTAGQKYTGQLKESKNIFIIGILWLILHLRVAKPCITLNLKPFLLWIHILLTTLQSYICWPSLTSTSAQS